MMKMFRLILVCALVGGMSVSVMSAEVATTKADSCAYFFDALHAVPHESLSRHHGEYASIWDKNLYKGCEVKFVTNDALHSGTPVPTFEAFPDSELYHLGWRMVHSIGADGPGSGIFAIEKGPALCLIRWSQPAYLAGPGEIVQSDTLDMTIQCRQR